MFESAIRLVVRLFNALRGIGQWYTLRHEVDSSLALVKRRPSLVIFDVGANVGRYTLYVHKQLANLPAKYYLFEPNPSALNKLRQAVATLGDCAEIFNVALGAVAGKALIHFDAEASGMASLHKRRLDHFGIALTSQVEVTQVTLDEICRTRNIEKIDLLKLDVEGHELEVLSGAKTMLAEGLIDVIQFEFGGCNIDSRTYFQDFWYLLHERYQFYRITPFGAPVKLKKYTEDLEQFVTTNYVLRRL